LPWRCAPGRCCNELAARIPSVREPIASLSGGQRQTVAIARSLLLDPKIIMLDEPTAALGVAQTAEVLNLIERVRDRGLGVIIISHNMEDVRAVADRIVVLGLAATTASSRRMHPIRNWSAAITGATEQFGVAPPERKSGQSNEISGRPHEPAESQWCAKCKPMLDRSDERVKHMRQ
jgi:D-xylose transport system ATP-binding protein